MWKDVVFSVYENYLMASDIGKYVFIRKGSDLLYWLLFVWRRPESLC